MLTIRGQLAENQWAQIGAEAIAWELEKLGGPAPVTPVNDLLSVTPHPRSSPMRYRL